MKVDSNSTSRNMANLPLISLFLLSLFTLSYSANVFISIDCGSSAASYKDENGIVWTNDDAYIKTGESHTVKQPSNSSSKVMDTLRVFTEKQNKHCYDVGPVKLGRVLVRATFYYGNYDGKNSPPRFELLFDGYDWGAVNNSGPNPQPFEVIYTTKKETVSVCVSQLEEGQFPYISALEVRSLEPNMYNGLGVGIMDIYPLFTRRRLAFGTSKTIRFPEDPYDRLWIKDRFMTGTIPVSSNASLATGLTTDYPPPAVLRTAVVAPTLNSTIDLYLALSPSYNSTVYINWYFTEVARLGPNETRSFALYKDNVPWTNPFSPPYLNCSGMYADNVTLSANNSISLVANANSTLPPLINAMEVFIHEGIPLINTDSKDVEGLASLKKAFSSLQDWNGDPCLPYLYNWDWLKCNGDRVNTLLLGGYNLSGALPDFSSMDALHTINLANNSLRGKIPDFLGSLPNLQILNLENNNFDGTIPASLSTKKGLILRVSGNPLLCASSSSCPSPVTSPPAANSSVRQRKNILEMLLATIISSIILLHLS